MTNVLLFLWHSLVALILGIMCLVLLILLVCTIAAIIEVWKDNRKENKR